jgi:putative acetyltransferase
MRTGSRSPSHFPMNGALLTITREPVRQADVLALIAGSDAHSASLYPPESRYGLDVSAIEARGVRLLVARLGGVAAGCCGYLPEGDGTAELKRLFVEAKARGQGVGRALVGATERAARAEGATVMRLETGIHSDAALALYRALGYCERGPFGNFGADPFSVFMEKTLGR